MAGYIEIFRAPGVGVYNWPADGSTAAGVEFEDDGGASMFFPKRYLPGLIKALRDVVINQPPTAEEEEPTGYYTQDSTMQITETHLRNDGWVRAQEIANIIGVAPDEIIPAIVAMTEELTSQNSQE